MRLSMTLARISIVIGFLVIGISLWQLSHSYSFSTDYINLVDSGHYGGFVGGIVGPLWALAGVLLIYTTLNLQRNEISRQWEKVKTDRIQQSITSTINIITTQVTQFNLAIECLSVIDKRDGKIYTGRNAIIFLDETFTAFKDAEKTLVENQDRENAESYVKELRPFIYIVNNQLYNVIAFTRQIMDSVTTIAQTIVISEIPEEKSAHLVNFYFNSIGNDKIDALRKIEDAILRYRQFYPRDKLRDSLNEQIDLLIKHIDAICNFNEGYLT
ncbi:MAG: hypothetical protein WC326_15760 [Candidatus Delongbacteria bacterium]